MNKNIMPNILYPINGGYINSLKPTIQGTGGPGATINGQIDNLPFTVKVSENGTWSYSTANNMVNLTDHTISLTQTDSSGMVSSPVILKFRTDTNMLVTHTVDYPTINQFINTKSPVFKGTGKPGATIEINACNSVYTTIVNSEGSWQVQADNLPEGQVSLTAVQKDMGNTGQTVNVSFTVDSVAPGEVILDTPADQSFINNPRPVVSGKSEPNAAIDAIVDEKVYATTANRQGAWSFEISETLLDDTHIISAKQKDQAGNISPENVRLFTIKTTQPSTPAVISPINGSIISQASPILAGNGETGCRIEARIFDKVYSAQVSSDGSWELRFPEKLVDGTHTFKICQVDPAGNFSENVDLTVKIDTTVPAAPVIIYPEKGGYVNSTSFTIKGTGEPDAVIECTVAGKEYSAHVAADGSWSIPVNDNESIKYAIAYAISAKQVDLAGNTSTGVKVEFHVDTESLKAPEVAFPTNNSSINTQTPIFSGTGKSGATVQLSLNNESFTTTAASNNTWRINIGKTLRQGAYSISVSQTDFGNISPVTTVNFNIDISAPCKPQITAPAENQNISGKNVVIQGMAEAKARIDIKLDNQSYAVIANDDCTWEYKVMDTLENGIHSVLVSQTDYAGNKSAYSSVNFVSFIEQKEQAASGKPATFEILYNPAGPDWSTETIATFKTDKPVTVNNVYGTVFSMVIRANGAYHMEYTDSQGNSQTITAAASWIDHKPPVVDVQSSGNYFSSDKTINYFKPCGSPVNVALLNGEPFQSGIVVSTEGKYKIEISDQAGNMASEEFVIDKTPPAVYGIENNKVYSTDVTINYSDSLSGIKSAMLNDQNILPGAVLTTNGNYTLKLTDNAENKAVINFMIQK